MKHELLFSAGSKAAAADKSASGASGGDAQGTGEDFQIGERVWVNGNKPGYVQFLGETQFAPGQWAGIVLDEPIGKNDGSVAGVRYFQCEALRGIFTRPSKLSRTEGEANGNQTAPPSRAASPTPSAKSALPSAAKKASSATPATPASNLARTNSESVSNLSETGSVKKGERELKIGDRVLVTGLASLSMTTPGYICAREELRSPNRCLLHRWVAPKRGWFVFLEKQTLPKGNGAAWNWMSRWERMTGLWQARGTQAGEARNDRKVVVTANGLYLCLIVFPFAPRYFQCQTKYGLFAPVHKVTRIGFPSTTPAKAKTTVRKTVATPSGLKRSPSSSSISTMSSVASSVSAKPSRTGLVRRRKPPLAQKPEPKCVGCFPHSSPCFFCVPFSS